MNNQIQQTYDRTTSSGSGDALPLSLGQTTMTDHAALNVNLLAAAKETLRCAQARQDRRGVDVLDKWILSQEHQGPETCKVLWSRAMDMAFNLGEEECEAGHEQADVPALLQDVPVLIEAWRGGWKFHKKSTGELVLASTAQ
ncbi:hypothetical protein [Achromobacter sp.]|uniref:hypothetical protein n=1 Tax=Achromobacter sp. TaxID=134375 RepID=UPI00289A6F4D|nr:hypothetical protein [Achromobacter sp.]